MKVGDVHIALLAGYNNPVEKKIVETKLNIVRCHALRDWTFKKEDGSEKTIKELPECETIFSTRITKKKTKELLDKGYTYAAGYFLKC